MKTFLLIVVLVSSSFSSATMIIPAYNEIYCPRIDDIAQIVRESDWGGHVFETYRVMSIVEEWNKSFMWATDTMIISNKTPLCVGLMDDKGAPNAGAVGTQYILMGVSLIEMLETNYGKYSLQKSVNEKFVLAHEYSHFLQNLYYLEFDYVLPMLSTKIKEQHADCMAAYILQLNQSLPVESTTALESFIIELADSHIVGDHGTSEQRIMAYKTGSGLAHLAKSSGATLTSTTTETIIKECGRFYVPTSRP